MDGEGGGNINEPARTKIVWSGGAGAMFSVWNGSDTASGIGEHWQNCQLRNMQLEGSDTATIGVEGYNDTLSGGCWRNRYSGLFITGLDPAGAVGIYLGSGTGNDNANDSDIDYCYILGASGGLINGVEGGGATNRLLSTTFKTCYNAVVPHVGSEWSFTQCLFSASENRDIEPDGLAQKISAVNCWFENSVNCIFGPSAVGVIGVSTLNFTGCFLHTDSAAAIIDLNNLDMNFSAKGCLKSAASASAQVINVSAATEYDIATSNLTIDTGFRIRCPSAPIQGNQGNFGATLTADIANATGDGTVVNLSASAFTEAFDRLSYFGAATGVFTAGLPGHYQFNVQVALAALGAGHTEATVHLVTTTQTYLVAQCNAAAMRGATSNALVLSGSITAGMVATDTAHIRVTVSNSTKTVTVSGSNSVFATRFDGFMVG